MDTIRLQFLTMLSFTLEQLAHIRQALYQRNYYGLGDTVQQLDKHIDSLEVQVEEACLSAIATGEYADEELRLLVAVFKNISDAERMGDYATHIARDLENLAPSLSISQYSDILPLLNQLSEMLDTLSYGFVQKHLESLKNLHHMDLAVDVLYEQLQRSTITRILENPQSAQTIFRFSHVARSFERLGDHCVNMGERLEYWLTGNKHQKP